MKTLLVILLLALPCLAGAQTIAVRTAQYPCLGAPHLIEAVVSGTFASDNKFSVQVRAANSVEVLSEVPATYDSPIFKAVHTDSSLSLIPELEYRIVASSPRVESHWHKFIILSKGTISMTPSLSDTINAGDDLPVVFRVFSKRPVKILLSNGQRFTTTEYKLGYYDSFWKVAVRDEKAFKIVKAENTCGLMQTSGLIKPVFNPISVRAHLIAPYVACEETDLRVAISTSGGTFDAGTNYNMRFREITRDGLISRSITVPAVLRDSLVVAKIPKLSPGIRVRYQIQVITANPATVSAPAIDTLTIHPKPSVLFTTPSTTLVPGQSTPIQVQFSGIPPFSARISNGIELSADNNAANPTTTVTPFRTTRYSLESFTTGCEREARPVTSTIIFTVKPGISVAGSARVCAGTWGRIPFIANIPEESAKSFKLYGYLTTSKHVYSFETRRVGDVLEFFVPELPGSTPRSLHYDNLNGFKIVSGDSLYSTGDFSNITILSKPDYTIRSTSVLKYDQPELINFYYDFTGNGPYTIEYGHDKKVTVAAQAWGHPRFFVTQDTTLRIRSISNSCFTTERETVSQISFNPGPPSILLTPLETAVCVGDSIEITFKNFGDFLPGNEFLIHGFTECCNYETWATVTEGGTYKIKFPKTRNDYEYIYLRVSATNPVVSSEILRISQRKPLLEDGTFYPVGTKKSPFTMVGTDSLQATVSSVRAIRSWIYSDGMTDKTALVNVPTFFRVPPGQVKTFTVKSVANECGSRPVNKTITIANVPYLVTIPDYSGSMRFFCIGKPASIPYEVSKGKANAQSRFRIELSKPNEITSRIVADGETSGRFNFYFPEDLPPGPYEIRVASSDGAISAWKQISIGAPPAVIVSTDMPQPIRLQYGEKFSMNLDFVGSSPYSAVFDDNAAQVYTGQAAAREVTPSESGNYSVKSVSNVCGFGSIEGDVSVEVAPFPVRLISFEAMAREGNADLVWRTSEEINSDYFQVERSFDGKTWHPLGKVSAIGESIGTRYYTFTDEAPADGQNLYRLKMVDRDDTFSYSRIAILFFEAASDLALYPNPARDELRLRPGRDLGRIKSVRISNLYGVKVYSSENVQFNNIDIQELPSGIYILKIETAGGDILTHRFVKVK